MMKKILVLLLCAMLGVCAFAQAEPAPGYDIVYSANNPIPDIVDAVRPAVVRVNTKTIVWTPQDGTSEQDLGYASGVYIDARGYIVTNYHVVQDADKVEVELLDGTILPATVAGYDDGTDIAVLKIEEALDAQPVPMGDSDKLRIGELAIAIGNPGDSVGVLYGSVTAGIISALDREDVDAGNFSRSVRVIQSDAAINTGNSGGALLNAKGELIGIPTLKISFDQSTIYEGLGFAVPINTVKPVVEQLIESGKVVRPRLGITVANIDGPEEPLRNYPPVGVEVMAIEPGAPADQAGIKLYDIIMEINNLRVRSFDELTAEIDAHDFGETVTLKICRFYDSVSGEPLEKYEIVDVRVELAKLD